MKRFGLSLPDLMVPGDALREKIAQQLVPATLGADFESTRAAVTENLDYLRAKLMEFDPTLAAAMEKSRTKVQYQVDKMKRKTARESLRRDERASADTSYLRGVVYPEGHLQERLHSILPFLAKYGMELVDKLYAEVKPECPDHRVITL